MDHPSQNQIDELVARARRTETRLTKLCMHMNVEVVGEKPKLKTVPDETLAMELPALDTSVGECLRFAKDNGMIGEISLWFQGSLIGFVIGEGR